MLNEIAATVSLAVAVTAVLLSLWQNVLQRRALQTQVFLQILEQSLTSDVTRGINVLISLPNYDSFEAYLAGESQETQDTVFRLVDFLNNTASLVEQGLIPRQQVWDVYFWAFRIAHQKLMPWWLEGIRQHSYSQRLSYFDRMSAQVAETTDQQIKAFDARRRR